MYQSDELGFKSLGDMYHILLRHRWRGVSTFVILFALILLALSVWPRSYQSEAKLFVRLGRESVTLDPTATTGQTVSVQESRDKEVKSIQDMIQSRVIAEGVVDALGPDHILRKGPPGGEPSTLSKWVSDSKSAIISSLRSMLGEPEVPARENAVTQVLKKTRVHIEENSNVISVRYLGSYAEQAQTITASLVDEYVRVHLQINRNPGSYDFFNDQTDLLKQKVENAAAALRDKKNAVQVASLPKKRELLQVQVNELEKAILATESGLSVARAGISALQKHIDQLPKRLETIVVTGLPNLAGDNMRQELYELEIKHQEMKSKFTDNYPPLIAIKQQLEDARKTYAEQPEEKVQSTSAHNNVRRDLELNMVKQQATIAPLEAERETLQQQLAKVHSELEGLNSDEIQIDQLEREYQLATANLSAYSEKLEQARIDQALEEQRISNVNVLQPANLVLKPANPRLGLTLMLGLVVAGIGALFAIVLAEYLDRSLKSPEDTEQRLELPVLMTIPRMRSQQLIHS